MEAGLIQDSWHPALKPFAGDLEALLPLCGQERLDALNMRARALDLRNAFGRPLSFVSAQGGTKAADYEWAIGGALGEESGCIETRTEPAQDAWHDLLNALCWFQFPKTKASLNALHLREIAGQRSREAYDDGGLRSGNRRTPARDKITLLDENGALILGLDEGVRAQLSDGDWSGLFLGQREALASRARLLVFGHGLLQKCVRPFKSMTARVWCLPLSADASLGEIDATLSECLLSEYPHWPVLPLPVCGWPGWWTGVQDEVFYQDATVFRKPRPKIHASR